MSYAADSWGQGRCEVFAGEEDGASWGRLRKGRGKKKRGAQPQGGSLGSHEWMPGKVKGGREGSQERVRRHLCWSSG